MEKVICTYRTFSAVKSGNDRIIAVTYSQTDKIITCYVDKFPL